MAGNPSVFELLEEMLDTGRTPEEVCCDCPELLPEVRRRWTTFRRIDAEFAALLPPSNAAQDAAAMQPSPRSVELPQVSGYRVEGVLGQGGMGIVYRAWHLRLDRAVALKMLLVGPYARPDERERFLREAQSVGALKHPNIVQVHDAGEVDGRAYFTMELVEGGDLADQIQGVPQPARKAADLVATIAGAVQVAHESGIVHRDLKPNNILLTKDGTPKVTDFGLARRMEAGGELTFIGAPLGTPSYMAPEQARGHRGGIGPSTDVYALGAILYELLTGRPPFRAESPPGTLQQVVADEPVPPARLNPRVPRDLETICLKCLHKEPHKRYASAQALEEDLRRFERGEPIKARPVGPVERAVRWVRRRPALALGVLLASALVVTVLWWYGQRMGLEAAAVAYAEADLSESEQLRDKGEFKHSAAVLQRAKDRLREFVPPELRDRLQAAFDNLELVTRLDAIRQERALVKPPIDELGVVISPVSQLSEAGQGVLSEAPARRYEEAFQAAAIGVVGEDPAKVAARISNSPMRVALVAALDDWAGCAVNRKQQAWVLAVVRQADPDPWRDRVRDSATWDDGEALRDLATRARISEQSPQLLAVLGARLRARNIDTKAFMTRVVSAYPADFWVNIEMGNALSQQSQTAEAIGYYRTALALRPQTAPLHYAIGGLYMGTQRWDEAIAEYQQALRLDPENAWGHNRLGFTLGWKGSGDEAVAEFRKAITIDPSNGWSHYFLAIGLERKDVLAEAVDEFQAAARLLPEKRAESRRRLRGLLLKLGRSADAVGPWKVELAAHPPRHEDWLGYAELCLFLGDESEYRRARSELLMQFSSTQEPAVAELTGRACLIMPGDDAELQQAVALTERALTAGRPGNEFAYPFRLFAQGLARYRQGRFDDAIELMNGDAARVMGPSPRLVTSMAQHQKGQHDQARETLAAAICSYDWSESKADNHDAWIAHILRREAEAMFHINEPADQNK